MIKTGINYSAKDKLGLVLVLCKKKKKKVNGKEC